MNSIFQFSNPVLTNLEFELNKGFCKQDNGEIQIKMNMSVKVSKRDIANEAEVKLVCTIGEKNDNSPFYIKAVEKGDFRWEEGLEDSKSDILLKQNAPALLLSYLRPVVAQITLASPYEAYNIPFINFTSNK